MLKKKKKKKLSGLQTTPCKVYANFKKTSDTKNQNESI